MKKLISLGQQLLAMFLSFALLLSSAAPAMAGLYCREVISDPNASCKVSPDDSRREIVEKLLSNLTESTKDYWGDEKKLKQLTSFFKDYPECAKKYKQKICGGLANGASDACESAIQKTKTKDFPPICKAKKSLVDLVFPGVPMEHYYFDESIPGWVLEKEGADDKKVLSGGNGIDQKAVESKVSTAQQGADDGTSKTGSSVGQNGGAKGGLAGGYGDGKGTEFGLWEAGEMDPDAEAAVLMGALWAEQYCGSGGIACVKEILDTAPGRMPMGGVFIQAVDDADITKEICFAPYEDKALYQEGKTELGKDLCLPDVLFAQGAIHALLNPKSKGYPYRDSKPRYVYGKEMGTKKVDPYAVKEDTSDFLNVISRYGVFYPGDMQALFAYFYEVAENNTCGDLEKTEDGKGYNPSTCAYEMSAAIGAAWLASQNSKNPTIQDMALRVSKGPLLDKWDSDEGTLIVGNALNALALLNSPASWAVIGEFVKEKIKSNWYGKELLDKLSVKGLVYAFRDHAGQRSTTLEYIYKDVDELVSSAPMRKHRYYNAINIELDKVDFVETRNQGVWNASCDDVGADSKYQCAKENQFEEIGRFIGNAAAYGNPYAQKLAREIMSSALEFVSNDSNLWSFVKGDLTGSTIYSGNWPVVVGIMEGASRNTATVLTTGDWSPLRKAFLDYGFWDLNAGTYVRVYNIASDFFRNPKYPRITHESAKAKEQFESHQALWTWEVVAEGTDYVLLFAALADLPGMAKSIWNLVKWLGGKSKLLFGGKLATAAANWMRRTGRTVRNVGRNLLEEARAVPEPVGKVPEPKVPEVRTPSRPPRPSSGNPPDASVPTFTSEQIDAIKTSEGLTGMDAANAGEEAIFLKDISSGKQLRVPGKFKNQTPKGLRKQAKALREKERVARASGDVQRAEELAQQAQEMEDFVVRAEKFGIKDNQRFGGFSSEGGAIRKVGPGTSAKKPAKFNSAAQKYKKGLSGAKKAAVEAFEQQATEGEIEAWNALCEIRQSPRVPSEEVTKAFLEKLEAALLNGTFRGNPDNLRNITKLLKKVKKLEKYVGEGGFWKIYVGDSELTLASIERESIEEILAKIDDGAWYFGCEVSIEIENITLRSESFFKALQGNGRRILRVKPEGVSAKEYKEALADIIKAVKQKYPRGKLKIRLGVHERGAGGSQLMNPDKLHIHLEIMTEDGVLVNNTLFLDIKNVKITNGKRTLGDLFDHMEWNIEKYKDIVTKKSGILKSKKGGSPQDMEDFREAGDALKALQKEIDQARGDINYMFDGKAGQVDKLNKAWNDLDKFIRQNNL